VSRARSVLVVVSTLVVCAGCSLRHSEAGRASSIDRAQFGSVRAGAPHSSTAATLEAGDEVLSAALFEVAVSPSAARHLRIAERYRELGILDAAYDHYVRARELEPKSGEPYEGLARVWRDWGFFDRALGEAMRSVHQAPSLATAHNTLGTIQMALGNGAEARRSFEKAVGLEPTAAYALNNLCYLSFLEGAATRAFAECRAALAVDPGMMAARNNLALLYATAQRDDLAQREFVAAGGPAAAAYNLGLVHFAARQYDAASRAFDMAARQRPSWAAPRERARIARALAAKAGGR
jgi:tetratricopeptide (TPR) repeat protein